MTFAAPLWLLALLVVAGAAVLYVLAQRSRAGRREAFASAPLAAAVTPRPPGLRRHLPVLLYGIAACALVVALARPQAVVAVPIEQATVMLVTDHSRSMRALDIKPSRFEAAQNAVDNFLDEVPGDLRVGAVAFNHRARLLAVASTDRSTIRSEMDKLTAQGGTATGEGLALALAAAKQPVRAGEDPPPAAMILLADGKSSNGRDAAEVAEEAKEAGIPVHVVALGTASGALPGGGTATADLESLRQVAQVSGGSFSTASDADELNAVYEELGSRVSKRDEEREVSAAAAGGGLILLLAGAALSLISFGRLP
jgi:Ca-activated chloride channel family protein